MLCVVLSFCRIIQSAICLYNPSDTAAPRHLPLQQGRLIVGGSKRFATPFCWGRLFFGEGLQYAISFCIRGDFDLCCMEVPLPGKTKKVPLLCGSGLFSVVNIQNTWKCLLRCSYSRIRADRLCSKYLYNAHQRHCTEIPYSLP